MPVAVVRPGGAEHYRRCADVLPQLEGDVADGQVAGERELVLAERSEGRPLASARLVIGGRDGLHRPDLAIFADSGTADRSPSGSTNTLTASTSVPRHPWRVGATALPSSWSQSSAPTSTPFLGEGEEIESTGALDRRELVYFAVDAERYPEASRLLSAALLADLAALSAERQGSACSCVVAIDEFGAVGAQQIVRLAARCRGAGMSLMLGTQSLADLRAIDPTGYTLTEQVISNVSYIAAHRIPDPDSAERLARVAGTVPAWRMTQRVDGHGLALPSGEGTRTRQRDFRVGPDRFKSLKPGEAVLIRPTARPPAQIIPVSEARAVGRAAAPDAERGSLGRTRCF